MFTIRSAKSDDLDKIMHVETNSYPVELQAPQKELEERLDIFGIWVAEKNNCIVGFYTCVPATFNLDSKEQFCDELYTNRHPHYRKWFEEYRSSKNNDVLYVTSTAVHRQHQQSGIGKALVKHSLELAQSMNFSYRVSVLRIPGLGDSGLCAGAYVKKVTSGIVNDSTLKLYLSLGFTLGPILPNYETDLESLNFGIFAYRQIM